MRLDNTTSPRLCMDCAADISERGHTAIRCRACTQVHLRVYQLERYHRLKNLPVRNCTICGTEIPNPSSRERVCVVCRPEYQRQWTRDWRSTPEGKEHLRQYSQQRQKDPAYVAAERKRAKARYDRTRAPRLCLDCQTDISKRGNRALRCPPCVLELQRAKCREYQSQLRQTPEGRALVNARTKLHRTQFDYRVRDRDYKRNYYQTNAEFRAKVSAWRRSPDGRKYQNEYNRRRRARKVNQLGIITDDVQAKLDAVKRCGVCGERFSKSNPKHIDHVMPIAKGGLHDNGNLQVLCRSCNISKHARDPIEFAREHGRLL